MISHANSVREFNELVEGKTVVVDFFATWCGPCKMLSPVIEEIDREGLVKADWVKVDVDEVSELAIKYGIQAIPTLIIFKNGEAKDVLRGFMGKPQLVNAVNKVIE